MEKKLDMTAAAMLQWKTQHPEEFLSRWKTKWTSPTERQSAGTLSLLDDGSQRSISERLTERETESFHHVGKRNGLFTN